jgi:hypothetical protein
MTSSAQPIVAALGQAFDSSAATNLSPTSRQTMADIQRLVADVSDTVRDRDILPLLDEFVREAKLAVQSGEMPTKDSGQLDDAGRAARDAAEQAQRLLTNLVSSIRLIIFSSEFRDLIAEAICILGECFTQDNPEMRKEVYHQAGKVKYGQQAGQQYGQTPSYQPGQSSLHHQPGQQALRQPGQSALHQPGQHALPQPNKPLLHQPGQSALHQQYGQTASYQSGQSALHQPGQPGQAGKPMLHQPGKQSRDTPVVVEEAGKKAHKVVDEVLVPGASKVAKGEATATDVAMDVARDAVNKLDRAVTEMQFTDEQQDRMWQRILSLSQALHDKPEYREAYAALEALEDPLFDMVDETHKQASETSSRRHLRRALYRLRQLLENMAGGASFEPVNSAFRTLVRHIQRDNKAMDAMRTARDQIDALIQHPNRANRQNVMDAVENARRAVLTRYEPDARRLRQAISNFTRKIVEDNQHQQIMTDVQRVVQDLFLDANGNPTIKTELIRDFAVTIVRAISSIRYLSLPTIDQEDDTLKFVLSDVELYCRDILPSQILVQTDTMVSTTKTGIPAATRIHVSMSDIRAQAIDAPFYYRRKKMPQLTDTGLLDLDMTKGHGMTIKFDLLAVTDLEGGDAAKSGSVTALAQDKKVVAMHATESAAVAVANVDVTIDGLRILFHDTERHGALYTIFSPIINSRAKTSMETELQSRLQRMLAAGLSSAFAQGSEPGKPHLQQFPKQHPGQSPVMPAARERY